MLMLVTATFLVEAKQSEGYQNLPADEKFILQDAKMHEDAKLNAMKILLDAGFQHVMLKPNGEISKEKDFWLISAEKPLDL